MKVCTFLMFVVMTCSLTSYGKKPIGSIVVVKSSVTESSIDLLAVVNPNQELGALREKAKWSGRIGLLCTFPEKESFGVPLVGKFSVKLYKDEVLIDDLVVNHIPRSSKGLFNKNVYEVTFPRLGSEVPDGCDPVGFRIPRTKLDLAGVEADLSNLYLVLGVEAISYDAEGLKAESAELNSAVFGLLDDPIGSPFSN